MENLKLCHDCGEPLITNYNPADSSVSCSNCGIIVDDGAIVSEVLFGENSSGGAVVHGSYVGADQTGARTVGPGGRRQGGPTSETAKINGKREIHRLANALGLLERVSDAAIRIYNIACHGNFNKGRRVVYVAAACAYIACRREKTEHMLIDFSDLLQINVFVLGATYLKLVKQCALKNIPAIDPSLYISRFAGLLEFGDETQKVAQDAVRLVQRFNRDWMNTGRRPAGICGACCLLAARMNNFRRSVAEIVQVVKIADVTIKKRLEEFRNTASSKLTIDEFRSVWLDDTHDPPAYLEGIAREADKAAGGDGKLNKRKMLNSITNGKKRPREEEEEEDEPAEQDEEEENEAAMNRLADQAEKNGSQLDDGSYDVAGALDPEAGGKDETVVNGESGGIRFPAETPKKGKGKGKGKQKESTPGPVIDSEEARLEKEIIDPAITASIEGELDSSWGKTIMAECDDLEERRKIIAEENRLDNLDEEELDDFILTPEESKEKELLWMSMNKDYLEQIAAKQRANEGEDRPVKRQRTRKRTKPRDSKSAAGTSAADATQKMLSKKKISKKLNYDIFENLFESGKEAVAKSRARSEASSTTVPRSKLFRDATPSEGGSPPPTMGDEEEPQDQEMEEEVLPAIEEEDHQPDGADDSDDEEPQGDGKAVDEHEAEFEALMRNRAEGDEQIDIDDF